MAQANASSVIIGDNELRSFTKFNISENIFDQAVFSLVCTRQDLMNLGSRSSSQLWNVDEKIGSPITFNVSGIHTRRGSPKDFQFKGIITKVMARREPMGNVHEEVRIMGSGADILLDDHPNCRSFEEKSINDIVDEVLQPFPQDLISKRGTHGDSVQYPFVVQYNETTLVFLRRLMASFGEWFYYDGHQLICGPVSRDEETGIYGVNIQDLAIETNLMPLNFRTKYHDHIHDTTSVGNSSSVNLDHFVGRYGSNALDRSLSAYPPSRGGFFNYYNAFNIQPDPVEREVSNFKKLISTRMVVVTGSSFTPVHVGNVLNIYTAHQSNHDPSNIDIGGYLITRVTHNFHHQRLDYSNTFEGVPQEMDIYPFLAGGTVIPVPQCPVQSAVVRDNNDPEKLGRVKVHFDWQQDGQTTPWIRTMSSHSGDSRGFYFVPEIGDEVVIGFEHNHPQKPYVIGSMFGGHHAPSQDWVTSRNDIKKIRTRQGNTIEFDDTSGSEKLIIYNGSGSSAGSSNNKVSLTLNPDKITIESAGDIEIKGNNLDLHATSGISIHSDGGNISVNGSQVSIHADGEFKAEGATAEVDGTGQVKIQGGIVQIN